MRAWAARIEAAPRRDPLTFVVAEDSGAWPDPTADAIYTALARQAAALDPPPLFLANLGDFAGPGTIERHEHHLRLVETSPAEPVRRRQPRPRRPGRPRRLRRGSRPVDFTFAHGHVRFAVLHSQPSVVGEGDVPLVPEGLEGPRRARGAPRTAIAL